MNHFFRDLYKWAEAHLELKITKFAKNASLKMDHLFPAFDCPCNGKVLEKGAMFPVFGNITHSRRQLVKAKVW